MLLSCERTEMIVMSDALLDTIVHCSPVYFTQAFEAVLCMLQSDIVYSVWLAVAFTGCKKRRKKEKELHRVPDL